MKTIACLIAAFLVPVFSNAYAGFPCVNSNLGTSLNLGGTTDGVVDPIAVKLITIRDCGNNPLPDVTVTITFVTCTNNDIRLCDVQPHHPGELFNCAARTVSAITDQTGVATFRIAGGATNNGENPPGYGPGCAVVRVEGVLLGNLTIGAPDENNSGGVNVADVSAWLGDRFGTYRGRSDLDGNNAINPADVSILLAYRFRNGSLSSCNAVCP